MTKRSQQDQRRGRVSRLVLLSTLLALIGGAVVLRQASQRRGRRTLTTADELRRLTPDESRQGYAVRLRGVVTHYNWRSGLLVIQDATGGIPVDTSGITVSVAPGNSVELEGFTSPGDSSPVVLRPRLKLLGPGELPAPRLVSTRELASGRQDYRWVEAQGTVRSATVQHDTSLRLTVATGEGPFTALLSGYQGLEFASIVDATIRVRGVAHTVFSAKGEVLRLQLLVPGQSHLAVVEAVPADPFAIPAQQIRDLLRVSAGETSGHRVLVRGVVLRQVPGQGLIVRDDTGDLHVRPSRMTPVEPGDRVDVLGFPAGDPLGPHLEDAALRRSAAGEAAAPNLQVLTSVAEVRKLTHEEAARGYAVRLQAVVTYYDPGWSVMFVQDPTGGIYVDANGVKGFAATAGQTVEVEGISDPGEFAPQIVSPRVRVLDPGQPTTPGFAPGFPQDPRVTLEEVFSGRLDSQWVEVDGVVQSISEDEGHVWLDIVAGLYRFKAHTADLSDRAFLASLVDARVRVRGACGTLYNEKRQLVGVQIYVPTLRHVSVVRPGPAEAFSTVVRPIASLLQFDPDDTPGHRVRVQGVVTLTRRGGLFIADETGGLFLQAEETDPVQPGDQVEAVGFPAPGDYAPMLRGAHFRKVGAGSLPVPIPVTVADASSGNYDARLVRIQAYLLDRAVHSGEEVLTLHAGKSVFTALMQSHPGGLLDSLRRGSLLELTGVCSLPADSIRDVAVPRSLRILLRSPADVAVLEAAPWWTTEQALWAGAILAGGLLASLTWGGTLRRRVRVQTERVRHEMERQAALEEQLRQAQKMEAVGRLAGGVAHDFNNLLGVITGYGELVRRQVPEGQPARGRLDQILKAADRAAALTRQLLTFSRKQILQPRLLDLNEVVTDLDKMLQRVVGEDIALDTRTAEALGTVKADPSQVEQVIMNLVVNARDAMPKGGRLTIETANAELDQDYAAIHPSAKPGPYVMLAVSDTGTGMDAETQRHMFEPFFTTKPEGKGTGLGLATVYGIVKQSGGHLAVYSELGQGTTFKVYLPRVAERVVTAPPTAAPTDVPTGCEVVLLVEDEDALRTLIGEILEGAGYRVLAAPRASEALRICAQHGGTIDLVLTDVVMPEMSGPELVERLADLRPEAKVLYMSGYTDGAIARHGLLESGALLLEKPFTRAGLARKLRQVLDGTSAHRSPALANVS